MLQAVREAPEAERKQPAPQDTGANGRAGEGDLSRRAFELFVAAGVALPVQPEVCSQNARQRAL